MLCRNCTLHILPTSYMVLSMHIVKQMDLNFTFKLALCFTTLAIKLFKAVKSYFKL